MSRLNLMPSKLSDIHAWAGMIERQSKSGSLYMPLFQGPCYEVEKRGGGSGDL